MRTRMRRRNTSSKAVTLVAVVAFCASVSSSSPGFPGTIQPPPYPSQKSKEDPKPTNQGSASDDEAGESSSDWDDAQIMEEDPLAFVVDNAIHSHSSDGEADNESDNENENENQSTPVVETEVTTPKVVPPPPPSQTKAQQTSPPKELAIGDEKLSETSVQTSPTSAAEEVVSTTKEERQEQQQEPSNDAESRITTETKTETPKPPPPRNGHRNSKDPNGRPSNKKPLQTLEKLQQLLDDTDYLTSSQQQQQQQPPFQNPKQNQQQPKSSPKSSVRGINSLWTSKDRTKYKKQQRLQKEQIRLKQQQEEQLRNQQQLPFVETEELSDTDDGLGYTLPNLPVYLSDGEEETDEAYYMEQQISNTKSSSSSSSSSSASRSQQKQAKQQTKEQYLQQQRDLFFAQQGQQQQPYPNQQQPPPNPYYGAGAYPPPPPMGFYPYGPPPPQYYQYHPSYYPYTRSLPPIETTVPRHPRPPSTADNANPQESLQQPQQEQKEEDSNKQDGERASEESNQGVVYTQPYFPQTPEQQEQWHLQQLRLLQAQEKYERDLRRKHQNMLLYNNLRMLSTSTWKMFQSTRKVSTCMALVAATCYAAVSPRNLPYLEYNQKFYENLQTTALVVLPPLLGYSWLLVDWNQLKLQLGRVASSTSKMLPQGENNANNAVVEETNEMNNPNKTGGSMSKALHALIHSFYSSFIFGYLWVFALEIAWTTILRLGVFLAWEPDMFGVQLPWAPKSLPSMQQKGPTAPFLILPWALREYKYKPKRITLLAADILTSCVACPIIEEFAKLRLLQWTMPLSKNYSWVKKPSKHNKKNKMKTIAEPITATTDETSLDGAVTNINPYIAGMLAVSLGIKWADAIRRVCMYTKIHDEQKSVYAFLRGIFPVQELCGIMTALGLARRDVLGQKMPLWKLLLPATIVHSLANLRGVKPIFKWNSSTPWTEMQLSPDLFPGLFSQSALSAMEDAGVNAPLPPTTKLQWFGRAFPKIMWVIILARAAGYCAKNYFMINRQAVRRATTYAGKHAAFSAELETAQKLKNIKNEYNE